MPEIVPAETPDDAWWHGAVIERKHWHFHHALLARYEVILALGQYESLARRVRDGTAPLLRDDPVRARGIYALRLCRPGRRAPLAFLVFSRATGTFVTALTPSPGLKARYAGRRRTRGAAAACPAHDGTHPSAARAPCSPVLPGRIPTGQGDSHV